MRWGRRTVRRQHRQTLRRAQRNICALCGQTFGSVPITFEHVVPRSRGGGNEGNLVLTHQRCNQRRADAAPTGCLLIWLNAVNAKVAA